jgi:Fe-S cluster assembly protein SufB
MPRNETIAELGLDEYGYDFVTEDKPVFKSRKGLDEDIVRQISAHKEEPAWMLEFRLKALKIFESKPMPEWGGDLDQLDLDEIYFYIRPQDRMEHSWDDVPDEIKDTFEKLGIPEAERKVLAGVGAQYESEMVYHSLKEEWEQQGVIFESIEDGLKKYPDLFREYRLVRVHPQGRESGDPASGLLPRERRADGTVRAYADHRRRGIRGPLHRGVHGAGLYDRLLPLGRH